MAVIFVKICVILEYLNSDDDLMHPSRMSLVLCYSINLQRDLNCVFTLNVCVNLHDTETVDDRSVHIYISLITPSFHALKGVALCYFLKQTPFHKIRI